ncbi:GNAT family N-acetyltransferase [Gallaecimonas sp. GXIMD4217]|uniref:GNAT family N-acetyltransferase n=1 Tax=Gallaecimonas sp. GXIMD4217 TaxID=3131927 RepID=UPI00311ACA13
MSPFPELATPRLRLTRLTADDAAGVFALFSDPAVVAYYDLEAFTDPAQAGELIAFFNARFDDGAGIRWAIRRKDDERLLGTCGFNSWSPRMKHAVIGYDLASHAWGQGYGSEAVRGIVRAAFAGLLPCGELNRIQADTVPGNVASERLLKNIGFQEEGLRRQCGYWKNAFHDLKCFGLLRSDFSQA